MTSPPALEADFPEYSAKETEHALASRKGFTAEQLKVLDELRWKLTQEPGPFEVVSTRTIKGQLVYRHPEPPIELTFSVDPARKVVYFYHFSAPLPPRQTIFISYSRQDVAWLKMLRKFLGVLEREGVIAFWDDGKIKPGEPWEDSIKSALESACAAVLLVSQDFLVSEFISTVELPKLLSDAVGRGKRIFWIPVSPSTVFESAPEITVFESLCEDPSVSLEELPEPQQKKVLVQAYQRLREAMGSR